MSTAPRRVLVTGSRDWTDVDAVWSALDAEFDTTRTGLVVVHGACPTGADHHAAQWVNGWRREFGDSVVGEERHPADWATFGRSAGPRRNAEMVALGADVVLAFPLGASRGTRGCMAAARRAGLVVRDLG